MPGNIKYIGTQMTQMIMISADHCKNIPDSYRDNHNNLRHQRSAFALIFNARYSHAPYNYASSQKYR